MAIRKLFTEHPALVGETYWQHFRFAVKIFLSLSKAAFACLVHAVFPPLFQKTASVEISTLHESIESRANIRTFEAEPLAPSSIYQKPILQATE
tara:strand:+ start:1700 stop:1981 length:282 start_codon:yes stop_codon:yes gene_type:complete